MRKLGYVDENQVTAALGAQCSCPVLRKLPVGFSASHIPLSLLRTFHMVPVYYAPVGRVLYVAFGRDIEYHALLAIEHILECTAKPCLVAPTSLRSALEHLAEEPRGNDVEVEHVSSPEEICRIASSYASSLGAEEVRLTRCGDYIWVRIQGKKEFANLIFSPPHSGRVLFDATPASGHMLCVC
jgi:hypothetical protein